MTEATQVEIRVPADVAFVSTLRTLTAGLGARCDLTIDQIEDLRIAVDEACALLLPHAVAGAQLTATFTLEPGALRVVASVPAAPTATPDRAGFAWTVLSALADELSIDHQAGQLSMSLHKQRLVRDT
jgi:serine/threonine-protein kinase RsbW